MRRPAKTRLAGVAIATAIAIPLLIGAATSLAADSDVVNDQTQAGNVQSTQELDVDTADQTTGEATSTGNSVTAAAVTGSIDVQSTQSMQGNADASNTLNVTTDSGATALTATATGNTGEADTLGGGPLTGNFSQDTGAVSITSESQVNAGTASQSGDSAVTSEAIGNTQGLGAVGGSINAAVTQTNEGTTQSYSGAIVQYTPGTATYSAVGISNNVTATGTSGATQTLDVVQSMTGDHTQAAQFLEFGSAQTLTNSAAATANNVSVSNDGPSLDVTTSQDNEAYLRAQAETGAFEYGTSEVSATGIGNSVIADETGPALTLNNTQINGSDITATNTVSALPSGTARSVTGVATAVGNSATFYVTKPAG